MKIPVFLINILFVFGLVYNLFIQIGIIRDAQYSILSTNILANILSSIFIYCVIKFIIKITDKKGIGEGDADVLGVLGLYIGFVGISSVLFFGTISSLILIGLHSIYTKNFDMKLAVPFIPIVITGMLFYSIIGSIILQI